MGGCFGSSDPQDTAVGKEIEKDRLVDSNITKILLLGSGGSGKSTFFKQLTNIHAGGFQPRDRRTFRGQIYEQMIEAMKIMVTKCEEYVEDDEEKNSIYQIDEDSENSADTILATRTNSELSDELCKHLQILWEDPAIQRMFQIRNKICVPDSTAFFYQKLDSLKNPEYIPTDEDLVLVRYRTTGMAEKNFVIKGAEFKICDVGGQRNERRKWIHFFDNVTAVLFVASLSSYDEVSFEDEETNSMLEALEVFSDHVNSHWFDETGIILFLNKRDLFEKKIRKVPLTVCWPEYSGSQRYDECLDFVTNQFKKQNDEPEDREIYIHVTTATDKDNVNKVFDDIHHLVLGWSLQRSGLV